MPRHVRTPGARKECSKSKCVASSSRVGPPAAHHTHSLSTNCASFLTPTSAALPCTKSTPCRLPLCLELQQTGPQREGLIVVLRQLAAREDTFKIWCCREMHRFQEKRDNRLPFHNTFPPCSSLRRQTKLDHLSFLATSSACPCTGRLDWCSAGQLKAFSNCSLMDRAPQNTRVTVPAIIFLSIFFLHLQDAYLARAR